MKLEHDVSLRELNTFGVSVRAAELQRLETEAEMEAAQFHATTDLLLGGGSNLLLASDVPGTVFLNRLRGRRIIARDGEEAVIEVAAGEDWHELVCWTLDQGLSGLENLSLIPGLAGAAPMQNIGAYGVELADVLETVKAWDWQDRHWRTFSNRDCQFNYRDSLFKSRQPDRYCIASISLRLSRRFVPALDYAGIREELADMGVSEPTAQDVSEAVIHIRRRRLPYPGETGNAGSFFKNPAVPDDRAADLLELFPGLPVYGVRPGLSKLSAAWMIEHCGWKGHRDGPAGVSARHALVLVNHGGATGQELLHLAARVAASVLETFGVPLEYEPRVISF